MDNVARKSIYAPRSNVNISQNETQIMFNMENKEKQQEKYYKTEKEKSKI